MFNGFRVGQRNNLNLVAIGDSQTADRPSAGITIPQTYSARIRSMKNYANYSNYGIGGQTSTQMLARYATDVAPHSSTYVTAMALPNDMTTNVSAGVWVGGVGGGAAGGISAATVKSNLKSMMQSALNNRSRAILFTSVPVFQTVYLNNAGPYITATLAIGSELGITVVDVYNYFLSLDETTRNSLLVDDEHPNAAGHQAIANLAIASGAFL